METPVVFGRSKNLFGIVNSSESQQGATAVVMLTAGMLHHAGSFRFHVLLARELEKIGVPSLRFDLSGIGESLATGLAGCSLNRAAEETTNAMDYLAEHYGVKNFILFGLCSGADDSWHTAVMDERVIGLAMIDGLGYPTPKSQRIQRRQKISRLSSPDYWVAKTRRLLTEKNAPSASMPLGDDMREFPSHEVASKQLQQLLSRGVKILGCYTSGAGAYFNYAEQFAEMFPTVDITGKVDVKLYSHIDHVTILKEDRQTLLDDIMKWHAACDTFSRPVTSPV
jgi:pimeloyl-ACP methyl ester carboxylesterase